MSDLNLLKFVDCPRDAIQGIKHFIATDKKIDYINTVIKSNLVDFIDVGSFVSPKAVPQMQDTAQVIEGLTKTDQVKLIAIIANEKGAIAGSQFSEIDYLGYPFSISETFQQRNTNSSISESFERVIDCKNVIDKTAHQQLMIYISMAFGNPYGDQWNADFVLEWVSKLKNTGIHKFSIADTTAEASPAQIKDLFEQLSVNFPELDLSIHLHSRAEEALAKVNAAYEAGCKTFEGAFMGYGGCPFAQDDLVGNIPTELLLNRFEKASMEQVKPLIYSFKNLIHENGL